MIYINNENELNFDNTNFNELKEQLLKNKECFFKFDNYYKNIFNSYKNINDLFEQLEKDIPRLDFTLQTKKVYNLYQFIIYLQTIYDKLNDKLNDINNCKLKFNNQSIKFTIQDLYKYFYFTNQSVFGLNFYILNQLYINHNSNVSTYVIDKSNSNKNINILFTINHSNNSVITNYHIDSQFYILEVDNLNDSNSNHIPYKKCPKTITCNLDFKSINFVFPEYIHIRWSIIEGPYILNNQQSS